MLYQSEAVGIPPATATARVLESADVEDDYIFRSCISSCGGFCPIVRSLFAVSLELCIIM